MKGVLEMRRCLNRFLMLFCMLCTLLGSNAWGAPRAVVAHLQGGISMVDLTSLPGTANGPLLLNQFSGAGYEVLDVVVTPDKKYALVSEFSSSSIIRVDLSDPAAPQPAGRLQIGMRAEDIAVSRDGKLALVSDGGNTNTVAFIDLATFSLKGLYTLPLGYYAQAVDIAPDNKTVALVSWSGQGQVLLGTINEAGDGFSSLSAPSNFRALNAAFSPDGQRLLLAGEGGVAISTVSGGQMSVPQLITSQPAQSVVFAPDGSKAYCYTSPSSVLELIFSGAGVALGRSVQLYGFSTNFYFGVDQLAVSPRGDYVLATNGAGNSIALVNLGTMQASLISLQGGATTGVAFLPMLPPTISGAPSGDALVGRTFDFTPSSQRAESFHGENLPPWMTLDPSTGALSGMPTEAATYSDLRIIAENEDGSAQISFSLTVVNPNRAPQFSGVPPATAWVGELYEFTPTVIDPDGDAVTFRFYSAPSWLSVDRVTGRISGTPASSDFGNYLVVVAANDGSLDSTYSFDLMVPNRAPTITGIPASSVDAGSFYSFTPLGEDRDGDLLNYEILNKPPWAQFNTASGTLSGTPAVTQIGSYGNITISVGDGRSKTSLPTFSIQVAPGMITCGIPSQITAPATNSTGVFYVSWGSSNLSGVTYRLERRIGLGDWIEVYSGTANNYAVNATVNGSYLFRVKAVKTGYADSAYRESTPCTVTLVCGASSNIYVPATNSTGNYIVSWSSSNVPAVTYHLERRIGLGEWIEIYSGTTAHFTVNATVNGSYFFRVKASKTGYADSAYKESTPCTVTLACGASSSINVPATNSTGVFKVSWGSSNVTGVTYHLERRIGLGEWVKIYSGPATSFTVNPTVNGSYIFRVKAVKTGYADSAYKESTPCTVTLVCGAPSSISVPATNSTGVFNVAWGYSNVAGVTYHLERKIGLDQWAEVYRGTANSYAVNATVNGSYLFRVKASKTGYAESVYKESTSCTVTLVCGTPSYLSLPGSSVTGIYTVGWGPSNVAGVTYILEESANGGSYSQVYRGSAISFKVTVLATGSYSYRVRAVREGYADSAYKYAAAPIVVQK